MGHERGDSWRVGVCGVSRDRESIASSIQERSFGESKMADYDSYDEATLQQMVIVMMAMNMESIVLYLGTDCE
jgi:hypothetical protein